MLDNFTVLKLYFLKSSVSFLVLLNVSLTFSYTFTFPQCSYAPEKFQYLKIIISTISSENLKSYSVLVLENEDNHNFLLLCSRKIKRRERIRDRFVPKNISSYFIGNLMQKMWHFFR